MEFSMKRKFKGQIENHVKRAIWITSETHRRTQNLSRELEIELFAFDYPYSRLIKYALLIFRTMLVILRKRPKSPENLSSLSFFKYYSEEKIEEP